MGANKILFFRGRDENAVSILPNTLLAHEEGRVT